LDFNPDDEDVWINVELEQKRMPKEKDVEVIVSNYRDNPFLSELQVNEIMRMKDDDPMYWQIYGLGNYGKIQGLVFPYFEEVDHPPLNAEFLGYGLDFGYTNDPTALVAVYMDEERFYLDEKLYERGLVNEDISERMDELAMRRSDKIVADSSEPKSIEEIKRKGWTVVPAKKGKDSINYGIDLLKSRRIVITSSSHNLRKELKHYRWKVMKDGVTRSNMPVDDWNHALDSCRYIIMDSMKGEGKKKNPFLDFKRYDKKVNSAYA
jgi:phage terminase large subunit